MWWKPVIVLVSSLVSSHGTIAQRWWVLYTVCRHFRSGDFHCGYIYSTSLDLFFTTQECAGALAGLARREPLLSPPSRLTGLLSNLEAPVITSKTSQLRTYQLHRGLAQISLDIVGFGPFCDHYAGKARALTSSRISKTCFTFLATSFPLALIYPPCFLLLNLALGHNSDTDSF